MSLKKIALIALIVVTLLGSVIAFGCKPKAADQTDSTAVIDTTVAPMDTAAAAAPAPAPAPEQPAKAKTK